MLTSKRLDEVKNWWYKAVANWTTGQQSVSQENSIVYPKTIAERGWKGVIFARASIHSKNYTNKIH